MWHPNFTINGKILLTLTARKGQRHAVPSSCVPFLLRKAETMDNDDILDLIGRIEAEEGVRVLFACEAGSRAWGFESEDSDYDVRYVYVRPISEYLRLMPPRDVIDTPTTCSIDAVGFDIRKFLSLMRKSNPSVYEWLGSHIVYYEDRTFSQEIDRVYPVCFSPQKSALHYAGMTTSAIRIIRHGDRRLKNYLYAIRGTLAARWSVSDATMPPPVRSDKLISLVEDEALRNTFFGMVDIKRANAGTIDFDFCKKVLGVTDELLDLLEDEICGIRADASEMGRTEPCSFAELDDAFRKIVFI